jgi:hypothetical protein
LRAAVTSVAYATAAPVPLRGRAFRRPAPGRAHSSSERYTDEASLKERIEVLNQTVAIALIASTAVYSKIKKNTGAGIADLVGKYIYIEHALFKNGQPLDVSKMYEPISFEIKADSTVICAIKMVSQKNVTVGKAKIKVIGESNGEKYWIAEWEGMNYLVRTVFDKNEMRLKYEIVFTNKSDPDRHGMKEVSELIQK